MGFFSKKCAVSKIPVMSSYVGAPVLSDVVALTPNGSVVRGTYDGYGRINGEDIDFESVKLVLAPFYTGQTYGELGKSPWDDGQGYFYGDDEVDGYRARVQKQIQKLGGAA